ncbi:MAG: TerB family tellurite resistance protein, partial [Caulobacterales bacterium]|nr:TerB family tellurite resistance protein [Caulobacterales bacterium]
MSIWRRIAEAAQRAFSGEEGGRDPERDVAFTVAVIGLGAKLARADGQVTHDEVVAFQRVFQAPLSARRDVARLFDLAARTTLGFEGYAQRLARRWRSYPALLEDVLDALYYIAAADGHVSPHERAFLKRVAELFGLGEGEHARIEASWIGADKADPYLILGVDRDIADADVRRAYRRAAYANHPDRFAARGLPTSAERLATEKMAAINAA